MLTWVLVDKDGMNVSTKGRIINSMHFSRRYWNIKYVLLCVL